MEYYAKSNILIYKNMELTNNNILIHKGAIVHPKAKVFF